MTGIEILIVYSIIASSITAIKGSYMDSWIWFEILLILIVLRGFNSLRKKKDLNA